MVNFLPSLLVSNIFDPVSKDEATILQLYEEIASLHYYKGIETRILFEKENQAAFSLLSKKAGWYVTFWLTGNLNARQLRLCDLDEQQRKEAVSYVKSLIDIGYKSNACAIGICSGQTAGNKQKEYRQFLTSMEELLHYITVYPALTLVLEPLDAFADKKHIIGDLAITKKLLQDLQSKDLSRQFRLAFDTAHVALNEENLSATLQQLAPCVDRIHFANAVLDHKHPLYGDQHLPFGEPGFLNLQQAYRLIEEASKMSFSSHQLYLTGEVRAMDTHQMWPTEALTRDFISSVIKHTKHL